MHALTSIRKDDGYIRRSSLLKLCLREEDVFCKTSKAPLDGMVSYLQDVMNPRTGEQMIVGGSDDGCIAFWTSK